MLPSRKVLAFWIVWVLAGIWLAVMGMSLEASAVQPASPTPPAEIAPPIRGPDDFSFTPLPQTAPAVYPANVGLKAVAIVGEVGDLTESFKGDMNQAVAALQSRGVTVEKFYYGERTFTWNDVVQAAIGAHFLLYMGHGVYWSGSCTQPTLVGGFYFGPGQFIHPNRIRSDLANCMAPGALVILSHVCFSAGQTACDPSGQLTQEEAARRVQMYAAPFVDIGLKAYFANNYYNSAANYVNQILGTPPRKTMGDVFKSVYPYNQNNFRDLSYPAPEYDLWLSGTTGNWHDAFVGIPSYIFTADLCELAPLSPTLSFTYNRVTARIQPVTHIITPTGLYCPLTWSAVRSGDWFTITPTSGRAPTDTITIRPITSTLATYSLGRYTGTVTVTVTSPPGTTNGVQRISVIADVVEPRLGDLPPALTFTYFISETYLLPPAHSVEVRNVGSDDSLTWTAAGSGTWFTFSPSSGTTPRTLWITPTTFITTVPGQYTGRITVTVTSPSGTVNPVQSVALTLRVVSDRPGRVYLPLVVRQR